MKRINCAPKPPVPAAEVVLELTMEQAQYIRTLIGSTGGIDPVGDAIFSKLFGTIDFKGPLRVSKGGPIHVIKVGV